jgi:DNA polymerase III subunit beta
MITVSKSVLKSALSDVTKAIGKNETLPIVECVLFTVEDQRLRLSATDLEMTIQKWIPMSSMAFANEAIAIPGKLIKDLVALAPEGDIQMEIDQVTYEVQFITGSSKSTIKCLDPREFPPLPPMPDHGTAELPGADWKSIGNKVAYAANDDSSRPALTGVLLEYGEGKLNAVCTDGFRIAVQQFDVTTTLQKSALVPARSLAKSSAIMDEKQPVQMLVAQGKMLVFNEDTLTAFQIIDQNYPEWSAILPPSFKFTLSVEYAELERSVRQALVVARESGPALSNAISFAADNKSVIVLGQNGEGSKSQSVLNSSLVAKTFFTVNGIFVLQSLKALAGAKKAIIKANSEKTAIQFTSPEVAGYTVILMPMETTADRVSEMQELAEKASAAMMEA